MKLKCKQPFAWAHRGVEVEHFEAGQVIETQDPDLIAVATAEGWASEVKAHDAAPENKAATPKTKGKN
jgi:hypothetical protein